MRLNLWLNFLKFSLFSVGTSAISVQEHWVRQQEERLRQGLFGNDGTQGFRIAADDPPEAPVYGDAIQLPIDHFGTIDETFANRYWVVDKYYKPGGPVFLFDVGEVTDASIYNFFLTSKDSFLNQYMRDFNGLGILFEHRYYGESLPYPVNLNTTSKELRYLSTEQALRDVDLFAQNFAWGNLSNVDLTPSKTPWVMVGCSYSGIRAALMREKFPKTIFAAYAASAPVQAKTDMSIYWEQVYRGMVEYGVKNCTAKMQRAINWIDKQLANAETAAKVKQMFLGRTAEKNSNEGFADTLYIPLWNFQGGGLDALLRDFCAALEASPPSNSTSEPSVLEAKAYGQIEAERWASWPTFSELVNAYLRSEVGDYFCEGPNPRENGPRPDCRLDERVNSTVGIPWMWQYCTEWGFLHASNWGPNRIVSRYNTLRHRQELCIRQFPDGLSSGILPLWPRDIRTNAQFGGWNMRPSNTFWTGGQFDPWLTLSPLSREKWSPRFPVTNRIPKVNQKTGEKVFGHLMKNAEHCYDVGSREKKPQAAYPQDLFAEALREWLPHYGKN